MAKKLKEMPEPEKPTTIPPEEPVEPSWPVKEPEVKPSVEPTPIIAPKEIPPPPDTV